MKRIVLIVFTLWLCGLPLFNSLVAQTRSEIEEYLYAEKLFNDGMYDLAALQFRRFAEAYPTSPSAPQALLQALRAYRKIGQPDEAIQLGREIVLRYPESKFLDQTLRDLAEVLIDLEQFPAAAQSYERIFIFTPESPLAPQGLLEAARTYGKAGDLKKAEESVYLLFEEFPTTSLRDQARIVLSEILLKGGEHERALNEINKVAVGEITDAVSAQAFIAKAEVLEEMGRFVEAEQIYESVLAAADPVLAGQAAFRLGELLRERNDLENSTAYFNRAAALLEDGELRVSCLIESGFNLIQLNSYEQALQVLEKGNTLPATDSLHAEILLHRGLALLSLSRYGEAMVNYDLLLREMSKGEKDIPERIYAAATVGAIKSLAGVGQAGRIEERLKEFAARYPSSPFLDDILFTRATTLDQSREFSKQAVQAYLGFLAQFAHSQHAPEALHALAVRYEDQKEIKSAVDAYDQYIYDYPAADRGEEVASRSRLLRTFLLSDTHRALVKLTLQMAKIASSGASGRANLELAEIYLKELKDYESARQLYVTMRSTGFGERAEVLLGLGAAYHGLAITSYLNDTLAEDDALFDSAAVYYRMTVEEGKGDAHAEAAIDGLWEIYKDRDRGSAAGEKLFFEVDSLVRHCAVDLHLRTDLLLENGVLTGARAEGSARDSLLAVARDYFDQAYQMAPDDELKERSLFSCGEIAITAHDTVAAYRLLTDAVRRFPRSRAAARSKLHLAEIEAARGNTAASREIYERFIDEYYYSSLADTAALQLSRLLLKTGAYNEAKDLILKLGDKRRGDLPSAKGLPQYSTLTPEMLLLLAEVYNKLGESYRAEAMYLYYVQRIGPVAKAAPVFFAVADAALQRGDGGKALGYWREIDILDGVSDSIRIAARLKVADFYFSAAQYSEALHEYEEIVKNWSAPILIQEALSRSIICLYRLDKITVAETGAREYSRKYKDDAINRAHYEYEKGDYYLRQKDFKNAEKAFRSVSKDFKETPVAPWGDLGLAKLSLILNKTDEALELLADIPSKYPASELAATAYFNLGDFYYKSRQLANAILALTNVIEHPRVTAAIRLSAIRYLIRCYDEAGLVDRAISLTREYLQEYPNAEDVFAKKVALGTFLKRMKEYDRAIGYLKELINKADRETEAEIQFYIGQCYEEMGRFNEAIIEYMKVKYLSPPTELPWAVTAMYNSGMIYMRLNELDRAKQLFQRIVLERGSESNFGRVAREKIEEINSKLAVVKS